jgi:pimeloyl-ACP methyl ester carboxylesterase
MRTFMFAAAFGVALSAPLAAAAEPVTGTAPINGLDMYYEIHGEGEPLVLIHGAYMSIPSNWAEMIPVLSEDHKVIAVELQAHGRTSDRDTPITYEGMADDVAALLETLDIESAAVFGYSMGSGVAIQLAIRHPYAVNRLIAASAPIRSEDFPEGFEAMIASITPEFFAGSPMESEYLALSPDKDGFPNLVEKLKQLDLTPYSWSEEDFARIDVPTLLIFGDADIVSMEHAARMFELLGGHQDGDMKGLPNVQLLVLPGTPHGCVLQPGQCRAPEAVGADLPRGRAAAAADDDGDAVTATNRSLPAIRAGSAPSARHSCRSSGACRPAPAHPRRRSRASPKRSASC